MPVFRVDKSRDFTVVANCVFKDRSLSAKAKGILVEMLSLPESWDYMLKGLTTLFSDGIDSIRQGINELEKHGYIVRERKRDARGRLGGMEYVIYETPHVVQEDSQSLENSSELNTPTSPEPTTEKPTQDSSAEEMPTVYKEINKYNKNKSRELQYQIAIVFKNVTNQSRTALISGRRGEAPSGGKQRRVVPGCVQAV